MNDAIYNHRAPVRSPTIERKDTTEANRNKITAFFYRCFLQSRDGLDFQHGGANGKMGPNNWCRVRNDQKEKAQKSEERSGLPIKKANWIKIQITKRFLPFINFSVRTPVCWYDTLQKLRGKKGSIFWRQFRFLAQPIREIQFEFMFEFFL